MSTGLAIGSSQRAATCVGEVHAGDGRFWGESHNFDPIALWGDTWSHEGASSARYNQRRKRVSSYDSRRPLADQPRYLSAPALSSQSGKCAHAVSTKALTSSHSRNVGELSLRSVVGWVLGIGLFFGGLGAVVFDDYPTDSWSTPTYVTSTTNSSY